MYKSEILAVVRRYEELARNCETLDEKGNALTEAEYAQYLAACKKAGVEPSLTRIR